ncbi:hypothetical protein AXF42_Ash021519 [Apostasia shenzhenica]|uniref:Uncharacterized protein n=1 Tax=Apostasia shenzhenica TaxID=1088818 RepID=A0A2H9ZYH9_9ASPA|nr:hypothetical protein AXF42_Ash021519 [Apostasia shenzhenica]
MTASSTEEGVLSGVESNALKKEGLLKDVMTKILIRGFRVQAALKEQGMSGLVWGMLGVRDNMGVTTPWGPVKA